MFVFFAGGTLRANMKLRLRCCRPCLSRNLLLPDHRERSP
jgi:hypothetical protein